MGPIVDSRVLQAERQDVKVRVEREGEIQVLDVTIFLTNEVIQRTWSMTWRSLNFIGAELGIMLEELQVEKLRGVHIPGAANDMADWLSRPEKWSSPRPPALRDVKILPTERRSEDFYVLPSPRSAPSLWGQSEESPVHNAWESFG